MKVSSQTASMTRVEQIARYCAGMAMTDVPAPVVRRAKQALLDWLGVILAGTTEEPAVAFSRVIAQMQVPGERATVVGMGARFHPAQAALANGFISHVAELDDNSPLYGALHAGATVIPPALAMAESGGCSGERLLEAIILGYEVGIRVGMSVIPSQYFDRGFHTTGMAGSFGAAAAAGKLLGLDAGRMSHAIAIAGSQAAGLRASFGTPCKPLNAGRAAQNGVMGALLAQEGLQGPRDIFEHEYGFCRATAEVFDLDQLTAGLGSQFEILNCLTKRYASCGAAHPAIDCVLQLRRDHAISPSEVARIKVLTTRMVVENVGRITLPRTVSEAKFSLPYSIAVAFHDPQMHPRQFLDEATLRLNMEQPIYRKLCEAVEVRQSEAMSGTQIDMDNITWSQVTIETARGDFSAELTHAKGTAENPMDDAEYTAKFVQLANLVLDSERVEALRAAAETVDDLENVRELSRWLAAPAVAVSASH